MVQLPLGEGNVVVGLEAVRIAGHHLAVVVEGPAVLALVVVDVAAVQEGADAVPVGGDRLVCVSKKSLKFKGFDFPEAISLLPPSDVQFRLKQVEKAEIGGRSGRHARVARR